MKRGETMPAAQRAKLSAALTGLSLGNRHASGERTAAARARVSAARPAGSEARGPLSYTAVHKRLRRDRGTPSECEHCGTTTAKKFEWAFAGEGHERGAYSADLTEYIRLCTSCHLRFDRGKEVMSHASQPSLLLQQD